MRKGCKARRFTGNIGHDTKFIFDVETVSGLKPDEIILKAIDILKNKVKDFGKEIAKL